MTNSTSPHTDLDQSQKTPTVIKSRYPLKREPKAMTKRIRRIKRKRKPRRIRRRDTVDIGMAGKRRGRRVTARELHLYERIQAIMISLNHHNLS